MEWLHNPQLTSSLQVKYNIEGGVDYYFCCTFMMVIHQSHRGYIKCDWMVVEMCLPSVWNDISISFIYIYHQGWGALPYLKVIRNVRVINPIFAIFWSCWVPILYPAQRGNHTHVFMYKDMAHSSCCWHRYSSCRGHGSSIVIQFI